MTSDALPLDRIRDLAANYSDRQGLRILPVAVVLVLTGFWPPPWVRPPLTIDLFYVSLAAGVAGYFVIGYYYREVASEYAFFFGCLLLGAAVNDHNEFVRAFPPMEKSHE